MSLPVDNLFHSSSAPDRRELIQLLLQTEALRIQRIESHGQPSPEGFWYNQSDQEWVVLLQGSATLTFAGEPGVDLQAGDYLLIPAHRKHRVERVSEDALWLAVHLP